MKDRLLNPFQPSVAFHSRSNDWILYESNTGLKLVTARLILIIITHLKEKNENLLDFALQILCKKVIFYKLLNSFFFFWKHKCLNKPNTEVLAMKTTLLLTVSFQKIEELHKLKYVNFKQVANEYRDIAEACFCRKVVLYSTAQEFY